MRLHCNTCGKRVGTEDEIVAASVHQNDVDTYWCMACWDHSDGVALSQYQNVGLRMEGAVETNKKTPNPGSREAQTQGCTCAVMDNHRGDQAFGDIHGFWITENCPLHDRR